MANTQQPRQDKEERRTVLLILAVLVGAMIVGVAAHFLWQRSAAEAKLKDRETHYLTLGETVTAVHGRMVVMKLSVEYVGQETEKALHRAMPELKGEVLRRMSQVGNADLRHLKTPEGKRELADDLLAATRETLGPGKLSRNVKGILFEKFLIDS